MRILCLVPGGISDQILFFPTLRDLKQQYANAAIDVVVEPKAKTAYRVCQDVSDIIVFDYKDRNSLADYLNFLGVIRDREYDAAICLSNRWTLGLLLWLNGIPVRIGEQTSFAWVLSHPIQLKQEQYIAYKYHDLLQGLGIRTPCPELKITVPKPDIDWAQAQQQILEINDLGYVLLSDEGGDDGYPVVGWQKAIADLQQKQPSVSVVLLQSTENNTWVKTMMQTCQNLKVVKPSDVGKQAAIIAGANLFLCNDRDSLQLSVAVGTYTIALLDRVEAKNLLPPDNARYIGICSSSGKIADIKPETVLEQIWRG
jgi:ADP-heptose:LPS heptosyltransferase